MKASFLLLTVLIAGCVSPEQAADNEQMRAQQEEQQRAAYWERLAKSCDAIGYRRDTDAHANCTLSLHQQNR